ncbi:HAMP domain-containing protein [Bacillus luteolus]|uniref:histidine kinase n=1 Tax=Litchfieldia luteola TaxID=682179 RepID=A0ABR9QFA5_9BACI|nr:ATP-binding protein [Cytobacillus luteolus]MBE4906929.1 HAMP domain-containing protein [Cytobacillus luteolus]MBP1943608.1 signal transduction histidine kinase [Cytobacillus luteolus]
MNKISYKLGLLFFSFIILVEVILFYFLYSGLLDSRIEEELAALRARGESHRHVLEQSLDDMTIEHVALMESETDTDVVIMTHEGEVLAKSTELTPAIQSLMQTERGHVPFEGMIVESRWETQSYIASVSPIIINEQLVGHVYMFKDTSSIQKMISKLQHHFMLVGSLLVIFTIITVLFLSQAITQPLIRMKKATERLSKGDFSVSINHTSKDELGELANSIQTLANDLNHLKKERNEFLASISHELRTPLTYVKGYADIARRKGISEEERNKYLHIIYEESEHLSSLVKDLFELAKIDQHSFVIKKEKVSMCEFIKNLTQKIEPALHKKKINLIVTCPTGIYANLDRSRFEQVMINLLDNALKYSSSESTVTLKVKVNDVTNKLTISVEDEGIGIPESEIPLIFNRFHRVEKSRSRESGGTGLGLSIVKEIVEAHGGKVFVDSQYGKGTVITIEIDQF